MIYLKKYILTEFHLKTVYFVGGEGRARGSGGDLTFFGHNLCIYEPKWLKFCMEVA